ncbi:MAG: fibrobacter succinogenes major paralogous domain-containing protein, partial [Flavobacteriales bacterium]|nr:fibrobacter succinogenes major paralogous domain-containing protein [Flavobacteriales bacterium]
MHYPTRLIIPLCPVMLLLASVQKDDEPSTPPSSGGNGTQVGGCGTNSVVVDVDGIRYVVIQIGDQCWMSENLRTTHYRDGSTIPNVTSHDEWITLTSGAWCSYMEQRGQRNHVESFSNWYAATDPRGICPEGWHLPTNEEWAVLTTHLGGEAVAGAKMRSTSSLWQPSSFSTATKRKRLFRIAVRRSCLQRP